MEELCGKDISLIERNALIKRIKILSYESLEYLNKYIDFLNYQEKMKNPMHKFMNEQKDMDPEIQKVVNDRTWDIM